VLLEKAHRIAIKTAVCAAKRAHRQSVKNPNDVQWVRAVCYASQVLGSLCSNAEVQQLKKELEMLKNVIIK